MNKLAGKHAADRKIIFLAAERKRRELQPFIRACEALYQNHCLQEANDHEQKEKENR